MRKCSVSFQVDKEFNSPGLFVGAAVTLKARFKFFALSSSQLTNRLRYQDANVKRYRACKIMHAHETETGQAADCFDAWC